MENKVNEISIKLAKLLTKTCVNVLSESLNEEESITDVINILITAHVTSMFSLVKHVASQDEKTKLLIEDFINHIMKTMEDYKIGNRG